MSYIFHLDAADSFLPPMFDFEAKFARDNVCFVAEAPWISQEMWDDIVENVIFKRMSQSWTQTTPFPNQIVTKIHVSLCISWILLVSLLFG